MALPRLLKLPENRKSQPSNRTCWIGGQAFSLASSTRRMSSTEERVIEPTGLT